MFIDIRFTHSMCHVRRIMLSLYNVMNTVALQLSRIFDSSLVVKLVLRLFCKLIKRFRKL